MLLLSGVFFSHAQNEDVPQSPVSKDVIVKNRIRVLVCESRNYFWGWHRKSNSWRITYNFDTSGNIIREDWQSLKDGIQSHSAIFKYDEHGNLTNRKIVSENLDMENQYFYKYDSNGLMVQYYTDPNPQTKLLFRYNAEGFIVNKQEVTPTHTTREWNYFYADKHLIEVQDKPRGFSMPYITKYHYENDKLVFEVSMFGADTTGTIRYDYDSLGKKVREVEAQKAGSTVKTWNYNSLGQLIRFEKRSGKDIETSEYEYDKEGLLVHIKEKYSFIFGAVEKSTLSYQMTEEKH